MIFPGWSQRQLLEALLAHVFGVDKFLPMRLLGLSKKKKCTKMCLLRKVCWEQWRQEMDQCNFADEFVLALNCASLEGLHCHLLLVGLGVGRAGCCQGV